MSIVIGWFVILTISWQETPDLNTTIGDMAQLPRIDRHFGVKVLAYGFANQKPTGPFIVFDDTVRGHAKHDTIDFSSYSNRIKDRMLGGAYRERLEQARREYGMGNGFMKIIGLLPKETDRYFATKQLRAVALAELDVKKVRATNGHYEPDGMDGFNLIIDSVVAKDGRVIGISDEELRYSVVAKK